MKKIKLYLDDRLVAKLKNHPSTQRLAKQLPDDGRILCNKKTSEIIDKLILTWKTETQGSGAFKWIKQ